MRKIYKQPHTESIRLRGFQLLVYGSKTVNDMQQGKAIIIGDEDEKSLFPTLKASQRRSWDNEEE